jgi:pimeloyl-ACP methyl ester carboxylesterase
MPFMTTPDGVRLFWDEAGSGTPVVFVHEFGYDLRSWEPQVRYFSRAHRCIVFNARGYPPSDVPADLDAYSQRTAAADIIAVLDAAGIERAHLVGCSMGGFAVLHAGLRHPQRANSIVAVGAGYGAEKRTEAYFRDVSLTVAMNFETLGAAAFAPIYGSGASRVQFQIKDPTGWRAFVERLAEHDALGSANTMRGVQARRPSLYDLENEFLRLSIPTLVVVGDEDDHCLQPALFLKRTIPASGLLIVPKTGHAVNQEEPEFFNRALAEFLALVEAGRWLPRDPRANPAEVMRTADTPHA